MFDSEDAQSERLRQSVALLTLFLSQEDGIEALDLCMRQMKHDIEAGKVDPSDSVGQTIFGMIELADMILRMLADTVGQSPESILQRIALTPPAA